MRKIKIWISAALAVSMLSACSPTEVDESQRPSAQVTPQTREAVVGDREPDPTAPVLYMMFVYRSNSDASKLERVQTYASEMNEQTLLEKLIEYGVLEEGTEIRSFEIEGDIPPGPGSPEGAAKDAPEGERIGTLDLSQVPSVSGAEEKMMLGAIGDTFIENFEMDKLKLLVNGANYEGGQISQGDDDYLEYDREYTDVKEPDEEE